MSPTELPAAASIQSKGFTLAGALAYVEKTHGSEHVPAVIGSMDAESQAVLNGRLLQSSWQPFRIQVGLYEAIDRVLGAGDFELCWEIGKFTSEYEMGRIHKLFMKLASLDLWIRSAGVMWKRYYSHGALEVEEIGQEGGAVRVVDFNPISKAFCYDFGGWLHRTVELNGRKNPAVAHTGCVLDGDAVCRYEALWNR